MWWDEIVEYCMIYGIVLVIRFFCLTHVFIWTIYDFWLWYETCYSQLS